jgi:hypothetical protein
MQEADNDKGKDREEGASTRRRSRNRIGIPGLTASEVAAASSTCNLYFEGSS